MCATNADIEPINALLRETKEIMRATTKREGRNAQTAGRWGIRKLHAGNWKPTQTRDLHIRGEQPDQEKWQV